MRYTKNPKTKKTKQKQINEQCFNFQGQVEQNTKKGNVTSSNEIKVDLFGLFNVLDFIYFGREHRGKSKIITGKMNALVLCISLND